MGRSPRKKGLTINVEDFDDKLQNATINSPRSLEACRAQGIEPEELCNKTLSYFQSTMTPADSIIPQYAERVHMHYENNRQVKIQIVRAERKRIIAQKEDEMRALGGTPSDPNTVPSAFEFTKQKIQAQLAAETRAVEKMQQRQYQKIKNMVAHEIRKTQQKNVMQLRLEKQKQKEAEEARQKKIIMAQREKDKVADQEAKRREAEEVEKEVIRKNKLAWEEAQRIAKKLAKEQERKRKEMQERAREREAKQLEKRRQLEAILRAQTEATQAKARELQRRDVLRQRAMEQQREEERRRMEEQRARARLRTQLVKTKQAEILEQQRMEFQIKEEHAEERRQQFEQQRLNENEERRRRGVIKQRQLNETQAMATKILEDNRQRVLQRERATNVRLNERSRQLERDRLHRAVLEQERNKKRRSVLEHSILLQKQRSQEIMQRRALQDERTRGHFQERQMEALRLKLESDLQQRDRMDHVERMKRMQAYRREKLMEKIIEEGERVDMIKAQWGLLAERRAQLRGAEQMQKQQVAAVFERLKKMNAFDDLDPDNLDLSKLGIDFEGGPPPGSQTVRRSRSEEGDNTFMTTTPTEPKTSRPQTRTPRGSRRRNP